MEEKIQRRWKKNQLVSHPNPTRLPDIGLSTRAGINSISFRGSWKDQQDHLQRFIIIMHARAVYEQDAQARERSSDLYYYRNHRIIPSACRHVPINDFIDNFVDNVGKTNRIHDHLPRIIRIRLPRRKAINQTGRAKSVLSEREEPRGGSGRESGTRRESTISLFFPPKKQTTERVFLRFAYRFYPASRCTMCSLWLVRETRGRAKISARFLGGRIFAPRPRSGPWCLPTRVYQILSPTKLCARVRRHSSLACGTSLHRVYSKKR